MSTKVEDLQVAKKDLDQYLAEVDYTSLNDGTYVPSKFALRFMNFIKLVNGGNPESHKTPPVHLKMLDKLVDGGDRIANLCFRGAAKTTIFFEYLVLYLAFEGEIPGFGDITGMIYVSDSMDNGVKSARQSIEFRYQNSEFLKKWIPYARFTENYLEFHNASGHKLGVKMFGAKTGLRGTRIFGKRPVLAVMDDLMSDDDAASPAAMESIKNTTGRGVNFALDPGRSKIIFSGTPFNKADPLVEAVESGMWDVNVWPVCEQFPCEEKDFVSAWGDRFPYKAIKKQYDNAVGEGKVAGFMQELMLKITSEEERLVQDAEIKVDFNLPMLLERMSAFNFYITTDFATSEKQKADYSTIFVWALNSAGQWLWTDGVMERMNMADSIDHLFRLVQKYGPQSVGIETSGQQGAFVTLIKEQMMIRNIWFNITEVKPDINKLRRFNLVVPWFKTALFHFPIEMAKSKILGLLFGQYRLATMSGLKGKDDGIDATSQLAYLQTWRPSESVSVSNSNLEIYDHSMSDDNSSAYDSYIV